MKEPVSPHPHNPRSVSVTLQTGSWCSDSVVTLALPAHWDITVHDMQPRRALSEEEIRVHIGGVRTILGGHDQPLDRCKIAIVVDDHSRPTPVNQLLVPLLDALVEIGIEPSNIKILVAVGTHEFDDRRVLDRKLGMIPYDVEVIVPDCCEYRQFQYCGELPSGVPVKIHKALVEADSRIAISGVYPHDEVSFSGGAKILIGILALETISRIHRRHGLVQRGGEVDTAFRRDLEDLAELVGLHYSINCLVNQDKQVAALHCGDFRSALRAAVADARQAFGTVADPEADIVIANAYPMDTALCVLGKSRWCFKHAKAQACRVLVTALCDCPLGRVPLATSLRERFLQAVKRLSGGTRLKRWLRLNRRRNALRRDPGLKWRTGHIVFVPFVESSSQRRPALIDGAPVEYDWDRVVGDLLQHVGAHERVKVSVYRCAPMLFPIQSSSESRNVG
ncbi:lactate racemase domain-containing protein [Thioalkalivibrio sp. XN279]|uniref:lactate racemase domain-containing protein n=1 Tax=Thioalkalivibrio sp. XN279 TaxID=2714953 RepID=UPI00140DE130|nr:lactate racemase domain-containing protein [Thioalkalivibrio sp. XN279]NHA15355.1 DUF2088 domain-containing protein [Thioalkalivibrio sp. XN279]